MKENRPLRLNTEAFYTITIVGHLPHFIGELPDGFEMTTGHDASGQPVTMLTGQVKDQAMLHGLLERIRDLGLPLVSVELTEE